MDTSYLRAVMVTLLGGGILLAGFSVYQNRKEVPGKLRLPAYYSHQLYDLRGHVELVRRRLAMRPDHMRMAAE